jgi:hypothetical protein
VSKTHPLCQHTKSFGITGKLQEIICLLGQSGVFEEGEQTLKTLLGLNMSAKQIQRVSEHYGSVIEQQQATYVKDNKEIPELALKNKEEPVYMMLDGGMVFTREGWKEMKVGRIFGGSSCVLVQPNRSQILRSLYLCHFGGHKEFLEKWEAYTEPYKHKVFVADGAIWIWNWVEDCYPGSVQILDFFHAVEKIGTYAAIQYSEAKERAQWLDQQKIRLRNNEADTIIEELKSTIAKNKDSDKARVDAIRYYENNLTRMQYKTYLEKGYLIGSGAIESAHRNVIQQRLKLSGQRWSIKGAQEIANLRACNKSNLWENLIGIIKKAA